MILRFSLMIMLFLSLSVTMKIYAQDSILSEAKLYYNILNSEVHISEQDIRSRNLQPNLNLLKKLGDYLNNPDENNRLYVYNILHSLMQNAQNAVSRRQLIHYILKGITDPAENIRFATSKWLLTFPAEDFDDVSRGIIMNFLKVRNEYPSTQSYVILLAGHASLRDAEYLLKVAAQGEDETLIRVRMSAYLALARLGDQTALNIFIRYFDAKKGTALGADLLRDLAYTKQPRALDIVVNYLHNGEGVFSSEEMSLSPYAAWYLSDIFRNFPVQMNEAKISDEDLELCRSWVRKNYSHEKLDELLAGELQAWR